MRIKIILLIVLSAILFVFGKGTKSTKKAENAKLLVVSEEKSPSLTIHEGLVCQTEQTIAVKRKRKTIGYVKLSAPVMVAQADREEEWGFFQFPSISKADDGTLVVTWHMKEDSEDSYGKSPTRKYTPMMSKDDGLSWQPIDKSYRLKSEGYDCHLKDGSTLQIITPPAKNIHDYKDFPKEINTKGEYAYYLMEDVPADLQGVYLNRIDKDRKYSKIHADLKDPDVLRYAINDKMPIVWWGQIKQMSDESLVAGVYPGYYEDEGDRIQSCVSFYSSKDLGQSWQITGKIPFRPDGIADKRGGNSFEEPTFEVLKDSTFICVMRTGSTSPMYKAFSYDKGMTWTKPEAFTPNGVLPWLKLLGNGVLVLSSGRPGVQLRFNMDGKGKVWTEPIDMLQFMNQDGSYTRDVSCGYTSILGKNDSTFYLVYSDFLSKNADGETRKAIMFRKVEVNKVK